ncbi:hypothetical protein J437_LFUL010957, partial [Ladona fulva]
SVRRNVCESSHWADLRLRLPRRSKVRVKGRPCDMVDMSDVEDGPRMEETTLTAEGPPLGGCRQSTGGGSSGGLDLDLDLWEGQFEFVGDGALDAWHPQAPPFGTNGTRKSEARFWCEDLTNQIQLLQQQVSALADNQTNTDDRYLKAKQDNATLQARVVMLEEQLREVELRSAERLQDEVRRNREAVARLEREKQLELENCHYRHMVEELQSEVERLRAEAQAIGASQCMALAFRNRSASVSSTSSERDAGRSTQISELQGEIQSLREENRGEYQIIQMYTVK